MEHGISYSTFMHEMATSDIQLNRKVLSEIAVHEPKSFKVSSPCMHAYKEHIELYFYLGFG